MLDFAPCQMDIPNKRNHEETREKRIKTGRQFMSAQQNNPINLQKLKDHDFQIYRLPLGSIEITPDSFESGVIIREEDANF